ncbi:MAG: AAA family ATPase [Actinomycetota bacterium]|nr:AAA family ATPase [Actinomycetota bacterium]
MADAQLPTGVVTFLLSDIVGSTRLWEAEPDAMARALACHDEIIARSVTEAGGLVLKAQGEGDSSFCVFRRASDAARASVLAQDELQREPWPTSRPIAVRMALHTGEAEERAGDYFGRAVNRAARLRALADPAQILVSQATAELIVDHLPDGVTMTALGRHELKDLERPETIYLLAHEESPASRTFNAGSARAAMPQLLAVVVESPFVGRAHERELITAAVSAAIAGERRLILVAGEPGLGKTALCAHAAADAYARDVTVLYGRCDPDLVAPYRPFVEALTDYFAQLDDASLRALEARHLAELTRLVPSLRARRPGLPQPQASDAETERYLLLAAIVAVLAEASAQYPIMVVLDDLHWADRSTLLVLRHLVSAPTAMQLALVVTYRDTEVEEGDALSDALAGLYRARGVDSVPLRGLVDREMVALLEASEGQAADAAGVSLAHELQRETDGNPFFAGEILRHLVEQGSLARDGSGRWRLPGKLADLELPNGVREVVRSRVHQLGERTRRVLTTAAVLGHTFTIPLLGAVAKIDDDDLLDDLERAERAHLVAETGRPEQFRFEHALIQHTLYQDVGTTRRLRVHRRTAEALEELAGGEDDTIVAELAYHWDRGTTEAERDKALHYAQRAGDRALAQLAPDEAIPWYERALELREIAAAADEGLRCDLLIGLGQAQRQTGVPAFRETLLAVSRLAGGMHDSSRMVTAALANNRGFVSDAGEIDIERVGALDDALAALGGGSDAARARLFSAKAGELLFGNDFPTRRELSDQALVLARRSGDAATILRVLNDRCLPTMVPWTLRDRDSETAEALRLAEDVGDPEARFYAAYNRACVALEAGSLEDYEGNILGAMTRVSFELQQPTLLWVTSWAEAYRLILRGDLAEAEEMAMRSLQIGTDSGQPDAMTNFGGLLLALRWHQGRLRELVPLVAETAESMPAIPAYGAVLALAHVESDDLDSASVLLQVQVDQRFGGLPEDLFWSVASAAYAETAIAVGSRDAAALLRDMVDPVHDQIASSTASINGAYAHYAGGLYEVLGDHGLADDRYAEALSMHERLRAPFFIARTQLAWGRALLARSSDRDVQRGLKLLAEAVELAGRHGYANIERWGQALLAPLR